MSNDRSIAVGLMTDAARAVGKDRGPQHGSTEPSFRMIAELWSTHINHVTSVATNMTPLPEIHLTAWDVAQMMVMLKQARAVYGDRAMGDHYADAIGYIGLAGMLASNSIPAGVPKQVPAVQQAGEGDPPLTTEHIEIPSFLRKVHTDAA